MRWLSMLFLVWLLGLLGVVAAVSSLSRWQWQLALAEGVVSVVLAVGCWARQRGGAGAVAVARAAADGRQGTWDFWRGNGPGHRRRQRHRRGHGPGHDGRRRPGGRARPRRPGPRPWPTRSVGWPSRSTWPTPTRVGDGLRPGRRRARRAHRRVQQRRGGFAQAAAHLHARPRSTCWSTSTSRAPSTGCAPPSRCCGPAGGGSIVNMASVERPAADPGRGALLRRPRPAVIALTKSAALEYGPDRIRVNCVSPGFIHTQLTGFAFVEPGLDRTARGRAPRSGGPAPPDDVADVVVFLASARAALRDRPEPGGGRGQPAAQRPGRPLPARAARGVSRGRRRGLTASGVVQGVGRGASLT